MPESPTFPVGHTDTDDDKRLGSFDLKSLTGSTIPTAELEEEMRGLVGLPSRVPKPEGPRNEIVFGEATEVIGNPVFPRPPLILSEDDKAELYSVLIGNPEAASGGVIYSDVADRLNMILFDKLKEILKLIEDGLQTNPMNGDGGNLQLNNAYNRIVKWFNLPIDEHSTRYNGRNEGGY